MANSESEDDIISPLTEAFCDTCILLNYAQQEWEQDRTTSLLTELAIRIVISEAVKDEFESVTARRTDAYEDLLSVLLDGDDAIADFDPNVWGNDERHVYEIIGKLEQLDPEHAATKFRTYLRKFRARKDHIMSDLVDETVFTSPPLFFADDLRDVIPNPDDCKVIAQAADWAQTGGSGVVVTMDGKDILQKTEGINLKIDDEYDESEPLIIVPPEQAASYAKDP